MENKNPRMQSEDEAFSLDDEKMQEGEENALAGQRDSGSDEFDDDPDTENDDRVRGAGRQSLDQLLIENEDAGRGLEEGGGGLRGDRPDQTVNDLEEEDRQTA